MSLLDVFGTIIVVVIAIGLYYRVFKKKMQNEVEVDYTFADNKPIAIEPIALEKPIVEVDNIVDFEEGKAKKKAVKKATVVKKSTITVVKPTKVKKKKIVKVVSTESKKPKNRKPPNLNIV